MKRMAVVCVGVAAVVWGCNKPQSEVVVQNDPAMDDPILEPDMYASADTTYEATSTGNDGDSWSTTDSSWGAGSTSSTQRTHVIKKGDTLYSLARLYFNDQRRWKDIYEANRTQVPDPNVLKVGQSLVIPN